MPRLCGWYETDFILASARHIREHDSSRFALAGSALLVKHIRCATAAQAYCTSLKRDVIG
jgi:hypothetical protein